MIFFQASWQCWPWTSNWSHGLTDSVSKFEIPTHCSNIQNRNSNKINMKNLYQSHTLDKSMRCLDINLRLVKYFQFCYVFMYAHVNVSLYFCIDSQKMGVLMRVLILFPVHLLWTKHSRRGKRYFANISTVFCLLERPAGILYTPSQGEYQRILRKSE